MRQGAPEILIVHEDLAAAQHLKEQLALLGHAAVLTIAESLRALRTVCERRPGLVMASASLPDIDGLRICRMLRLPLCEGSDRIPVVLMSAPPLDPSLRELAREERVYALLSYPCEPETLRAVVEGALDGSRVTSAEPRPFCCANHVLVVSPESADSISAELLVHGWSAVSASTAANAKQALPASAFDLVLIDDALADAASFAVWTKSECPDVTVMVMTGSPDADYLVRLAAQGVDEILAGPADLKNLDTVCTGVLNRKRFQRLQQQMQEKIRELQAINDYFDMVIRHSQEAIFSCDLVGRVRIWNKGAEKMYGYSAEEIVGCIADDFLDPPDFTRKSPDVVRILRQKDGSFTEADVLRRKKSGEIFPVQATYSAVINAEGEYIGFSVIERDVATHKALEAEKIKSARLRAITQTAVTANDQINTPLGVILGYAQFLERKLPNLAAEDTAALEIIQQQVLKIKGIMNKLKLMSDPIVKNYSIEGVTMLDLSQSK